MTHDEFTQLFKLIQKVDGRLDSIEANMATKDDYLKMMSAVTDIAAKFADHDDDHKMTDNSLARQQQWIETLAKKTDVELSY